METLQITPFDGLDRLSRGLVEYQRVSGKEGAAILVQKGAQLVYGNSNPKFGATFPGLIALFLKEAPEPGSITAEAKARGFRLGRISASALSRAEFWMGGYKSILARPVEFDGRLFLGAVRQGVSGRRILGGRKGRGGAAVDGASARQPGEKRLGLRAVAVLMEINLRESGRHYLGASWLFKRWRTLAASDPQRDEVGTFRVLENVNPRAQLQLLGAAELEGSVESGDVTLRITSYVPGEMKIGTARGLFARAVAAVAADVEAYLARKQRELLEKSLAA